MPSKYKRKCSSRGSWTTDTLEKAFDVINDGTFIRQTVKKFGIPFSTLRDCIKIGKSEEPKFGKYAIFPKNRKK